MLSAESEAFENVMFPFAAAVNGPIEPREQRRRAHSLFAGLNKLSVFSPGHVYSVASSVLRLSNISRYVRQTCGI